MNELSITYIWYIFFLALINEHKFVTLNALTLTCQNALVLEVYRPSDTFQSLSTPCNRLSHITKHINVFVALDDLSSITVNCLKPQGIRTLRKLRRFLFE